MVSSFDISQNNTSRQLIVIGNGFDLQCDLNSKYQDFFNYRFGILLQNQINQRLGIKSNAEEDFAEALTRELRPYFKITVGPKQVFRAYSWEELSSPSPNINREKLQIVKKTKTFMENYLQQIKDQITNQIEDEQLKKKLLIEWNIISSINYSKWGTVFLLANCFLSKDSIVQWNDVENIIFNIVSIILIDEKELSLSDLTFKPDSSERYFMFGVRNCFNDDKDKAAITMLDELKIFEDNFADYINKIKKEDKNKYYHKSFDLLIALMHMYPNNIIDVLSFNYSLDKECLIDFKKYFDNKCGKQKELKVNSWSNIHGIAAYKDTHVKKNILSQDFFPADYDVQLPGPIFGIDNHDILTPDKNGNINFDDPRSIFTKSFRLLDNHINNLRTKTFQDNVNVITFFGHSLSQADYSYFESIFDQYDVFHSNVKLEFYYYSGTDDITAKTNERETMRKVVNLLTSYGATLKNEHGENIVNKLILEQRLNVLPNP